MRILFATEGIDEAGGVDTYMSAVAPGLVARGHQVAIFHCRQPAGPAASTAAIPRFGLDALGAERAFASVASWDPDVCFSQNMRDLDVDTRLAASWPVVKMMHGYFGTCVSGQKSFGFPFREPCDRMFGAACLAWYLPRRCGQLRPTLMVEQYAWARRQRTLFDRYSGIVLASDHMRREFERSGAPADKLHVVPLFAPESPADRLRQGYGGPPELHAKAEAGRYSDQEAVARLSVRRVLFLGRMTALKGGDLLIEAVAEASQRLGSAIGLTMAGDGPEQGRWQSLAARLGVAAEFPGWLSGSARDAAIRRASILAVPSVWPEPFGLTGLEAAAHGVPAVAFDVGGIREWLRDGENGILASGARPDARALAGAIVAALGDPSRLAALGAGARAAAARLSIARHLERLETILVSAMGGRRPRTKDEAPSRCWHILTGEYPPQPGGVADYTGRLAAGLAARGEEVHVWRPGDSDATDGRLHVRALPGGFGVDGLRTIGRGVDASRAAGRTPILLVQYAPNAFGLRGANVLLCIWLLLRSRRRQDDVRVMFHEPFLYFTKRSILRNALALAHRLMAVLLLAASRLAYVSTGSWEALLSRYSVGRRVFIWLPIPATVPPPDDPEATRRARAKAAPDPDAAFVIGHFSSYPEDVACELTRVAAAMLDAGRDARLFLIGRNSNRFARTFCRAHPQHAARVVATGELPPGEVAAHLRACDLVVQPYPDGATTRRTSLMAPLSCGVPTVTTLGRWSEPIWRAASGDDSGDGDAAVEFAPAGDVAAILGRCQALANDEARRRRLGAGARAFYERHFTLERTLRILCGAADGEPAVLIGVHAHPATGDTERRQRAALAALAELNGVRRVNLQFASIASTTRPVLDAAGFETMRMLQMDSTSVTGTTGTRKPIASEVFDLLARRALEEGCRYFVYVNSDTALSQSAVDRIASGGADAYVLARTDIGGGRPSEVLLSGSDGFAVNPLWWVSHGRRFRPYIIGEAVWDNVYAAQLACHGRTTFVYETGALTHERHETQWAATPFGRYIQYLSALDAPYFSLWSRFHDRLRVAFAAGDGDRRTAAIAAETFVWPPPRGARLVQTARRVKGWVRYATPQETAP